VAYTRRRQRRRAG